MTEAARVASPCIRECCLDEHKICLGCHRSLREICDWSEASDAERLDILARCTGRREDRERVRTPSFDGCEVATDTGAKLNRE